MKAVLNVNELKVALKKMRGFTDKDAKKAAIIMEFMVRKTEDGEKRYLKLDSSNGVANASVLVAYTGDNEKKQKYIVSAEIVDMVETISVFGEEVTIEAMEGSLKLECGDAVVPVGFKTEAKVIEFKSLSDTPQCSVILKSEDFANLISHGGFAAGDSTMSVPVFRETVILSPCVSGEKFSLRALSSNGAFIASADVEAETKDTASFSKFAGAVEGETQMCVAINYASVLALARRLEQEKILVVLTEKHVVIKDGNDVYLFTVIDGKVPASIIHFVVDEMKKGFEYTLDRETLKRAITVVGLTGDRMARLSFDSEVLTIEDSKHTSRAAVPLVAIKECKTERLMDAGFLKSIASTMPAELTVYGPEGSKGVYFEGVGSKAYLLPVKE